MMVMLTGVGVSKKREDIFVPARPAGRQKQFRKQQQKSLSVRANLNAHWSSKRESPIAPTGHLNSIPQSLGYNQSYRAGRLGSCQLF